jgi:hypothetical protein
VDTIHALIKEPVKNFDRLVAKLLIPESQAQIEDLAHNFYYVFGPARLHVLDMVDLLLQSDFYVVIDTLMDATVNFFPASLQCVQDFPHSTFCHKFVESIFQQCFVAQPADIILKVCFIFLLFVFYVYSFFRFTLYLYCSRIFTI